MNISEAAAATDLTPSTLRSYEKVGLIPPVERENGKNRVYSSEDVKWIDFIRYMRSSGFSIDALIAYTSLFQNGNETINLRKQILIEERDKMLLRQKEIEKTIKRLNNKIANYENQFVKCENNLADKVLEDGIQE